MASATTKVKKPRPCRAVDYNGYPEGAAYVLVLPKIDGTRGIHMNGELQARTLKPFRNTEALARFKELGDVLHGLDGELTLGDNLKLHRLCNATNSVLNRNPDEATRDALCWWVFDDWALDRGYELRLANASRRVALLNKAGYDFIRCVGYVRCTSHAEVIAAHAKNMEAGFEGSIVRIPDGLYKYGTTTAKEGLYLRIKDFKDDEAICTGLVEARENQNEAVQNALGHTERSSAQAGMVGKGMVGAILADHSTFGPIEIGPGEMTHDERRYYWEHPEELVGKTITFKYFPYGVKDKPRMPTYKTPREDV